MFTVKLLFPRARRNRHQPMRRGPPACSWRRERGEDAGKRAEGARGAGRDGGAAISANECPRSADAPGRRRDAPGLGKAQQLCGYGRSGRSRPQKQVLEDRYIERMDARCVLCVHPLILLGNRP